MSIKNNVGREPVPKVSMRLAVQFISSLHSILVANLSDDVRWTLHRVVSRNGISAWQQLCPYMPKSQHDYRDVGRIFNLKDGIIGRSIQTHTALRFTDSNTEESMLAIPFFDKNGTPVLMFFAHAQHPRYFSDECVKKLGEACSQFSEFLELLQKDSLYDVYNYPNDQPVQIKRDILLDEEQYERLDISVTPLSFGVYNFDS